MESDLRRFQGITGALPNFTSKFSTANSDSNTWFGLLSASTNSFLEVRNKKTGNTMFDDYIRDCQSLNHNLLCR